MEGTLDVSTMASIIGVRAGGETGQERNRELFRLNALPPFTKDVKDGAPGSR
jgi:hypothetical protein